MRRVSLLLGLPLCVLAQKPSRQQYCFDHPKAITCSGSVYTAPERMQELRAKPPTVPGSAGVLRGTRPGTSPAAAPTMLKLGEIDWRFAMPMADLTAGVNFGTIQNSTLARGLVQQLAAQQGLQQVDVQKLFDALGDVDQVAISVSRGRVLAMITGRLAGAVPPPPEAGMKCHILSGDAVLVGHAEAVDGAIRRLSMPALTTDDNRRAVWLAAQYDFWAYGGAAIAGMAGPARTLPAGISGIEVAVSLRDSLMVDVGLRAASVAIAQKIASSSPPAPFNSAYVEGNVAHIRLLLPAITAQAGFGRLIAGPLGKSLGQMVLSAKNMPARPPNAAPRSTKPVIVGLDNGPKEVGEPVRQP